MKKELKNEVKIEAELEIIYSKKIGKNWKREWITAEKLFKIAEGHATHILSEPLMYSQEDLDFAAEYMKMEKTISEAAYYIMEVTDHKQTIHIDFNRFL